MKYTYNIDPEGKKVICVSHYAGRPVRGIAKCNAEFDEFDVESGKTLAKLRCDMKIAKKRVNMTLERLDYATTVLIAAKTAENRRKVAYEEAIVELAKITSELNEFENKLNNL